MHHHTPTTTTATRPGQNLDYGNNSALLVGACLPHGQRVAGKVPVDILLQKRNFPAESGLDVLIRLQLDWAWGNITYRLSQAEKRTNWTCATPGNCRSIISIQVDTKPADGKYVAPDGPQAVTVEAETKFNWGARCVLPACFLLQACMWLVMSHHCQHALTHHSCHLLHPVPSLVYTHPNPPHTTKHTHTAPKP